MADLIKKDVRYLSRDFNSLKSNLIDFAKNYFPNTYQDFNEASPGMMFMEMAAYVGDVLSFYTDVNLQESMILHASEKRNIINLAQSLGYTPKLNSSATVKLDIFQLVPSKTEGIEIVPDMAYAFAIDSGMQVSSESNTDVIFRTTEYIDFKHSSSFSPTEITPFEVDDNTGEITFWLLKKQVNAVSGQIIETSFQFNEPKKYDKLTLNDPTVIEFLYAMDSEGNRWDYVPFLAQDTVYEAVPNIPRNDKNMSFYRNETPYLLKLKKITRKFTVRFGSDGKHEIMFGPGISNVSDEEFIPNPDLVGNSLTGIETSPSLDIDPSNFLRTKTYGLAPSNTILTIYYTSGNGIIDNVSSDDLTRVLRRNILLDNNALDSVLYNQVIGSLAVTNPEPASGGKSEEDPNEIRQNALAHFSAQNRAVTKEDYIIRAYSMPQKYGSIAKAYITRNTQLTYDDVFYSDRRQNNLALGFYVLGYDSFGKLNKINPATKENLKTYLNEYRILTDAIEVKDAYIINIGIEFDIISLPNKNGNEVVLKCIDKLKQYFDIKKWQINQPIVISNIYTELDRVEGVQTVVSVKFKNLHDQTLGYSMHMYDIEGATKNGVIFPSLDPSIFEIKYPDNDILGRVRAF
jgi:hypothetical protein